jgi:hypothetical protein
MHAAEQRGAAHPAGQPPIEGRTHQVGMDEVVILPLDQDQQTQQRRQVVVGRKSKSWRTKPASSRRSQTLRHRRLDLVPGGAQAGRAARDAARRHRTCGYEGFEGCASGRVFRTIDRPGRLAETQACTVQEGFPVGRG